MNGNETYLVRNFTYEDNNGYLKFYEIRNTIVTQIFYLAIAIDIIVSCST